MNDLEERTIKFSEDIIDLVKKIKVSFLNKNILQQLLKSSTSIGANYQEANGASSKRDFRNNIHLCKKEAMETKYWLRLLTKVEEKHKYTIRKLWKEAHELTLIFSKISKSSKE
ncbi:MAG: four helix bundle protein [Candidatus Parcubacteria bacterium]|nr:MAG: four helix bundle protein [Candidatus Parcubacteria bacterium]